MGFLDNLGNSFNGMMNDPQRMALMAAAAQMMAQSGPSDKPVSLGEVMGDGMRTFYGARRAMVGHQQEQEEHAQQKQYRGMQMQGLQQQQEAARAALARSQGVTEALKNRKSPRDQMLSTMNGPTLENAATLAQAPQAQQAGNLFQELMAEAEYLHAKGFPDEAIARAKAAQDIKAKFDTTPRVANGPDGKPFTYVLDDLGNMRVLDGALPREEKKILNLGGTHRAVNPYDVQDGQSFKVTQSPDSVATATTAANRLKFDRERATAPTFSSEFGGFVAPPSQQNPQGGFTPLAGGARPAKAPTEFQSKSATFGLRAGESDKILTSLGDKYSPAAINAKQQVGRTWLVGDVLEGVTNKFALDENDQLAEQAQRDFINATLRQESGAAIGPQEFENAKRQYFPQPGDSDGVIAQKARNRKLVIQGFNGAAGHAALTAPEMPAAAKPRKYNPATGRIE